jgi:hypothetical protein
MSGIQDIDGVTSLWQIPVREWTYAQSNATVDSLGTEYPVTGGIQVLVPLSSFVGRDIDNGVTDHHHR